MKKLICTLLALTTVISLCACTNADDEYDRCDDENAGYTEEDLRDLPEAEITVPPAEPTEEEQTLIRDYVSNVVHLKEALAALSQQSAEYELNNIQHYYQTLQQIGSVEQWANTSAASSILSDYSDYEAGFDPATDWNLDAMLSGFTVLKDVKLSRSYVECDNMGNKENETVSCTWHYGADGKELMVSDEDEILFTIPNCISYVDYSGGFREYDEAGRLSKITTYSSENKIEQLCTFTYNENSKLVKMEFRSNTQTYEVSDFQYDEQGRLVRFEWDFNGSGKNPKAVVYTYNEDGTVAMVEKLTYVTNDNGERFVEYRDAMEYTYENGVAVSAVHTDQTYGTWINFSYGVFDTWLNYETVDNYTYTYDQAGRLVEEVCHHGNTLTYNTNGDLTNDCVSDVATTTYTTTYGDYIVYTPAN